MTSPSNAVTQSTKFPTHLVTEVFSKVKGKSSIAKMVPAKPIAFNGNTEFTFSMGSELEVVGEQGQKSAHSMSFDPVTVRPIKVLCRGRVTREFLTASDDEKVEMLKTVTGGFAITLAKGFDKMAMHGVNPYSGSASSVIGNNNLDYIIANYSSGANVVEYTTGTDAPDTKIDAAIDKIYEPNGVIINKTMRSDIAGMTVSGAKKYPEFAWGATPDQLGSMKLDSNATAGDDFAIVGDWNAFKWGYAKEMTMEVIPYGDPDGQGDLVRAGEVLIEAEAFIGWGILNAADFAKVVAPSD